ncbi:hypothetical protein [Pseudoduganella rivuli]|nr:hypothetical protein [Pseudoduganella rivuli]
MDVFSKKNNRPGIVELRSGLGVALAGNAKNKIAILAENPMLL